MKEALKLGVIYGVVSLVVMVISLSFSIEVTFSWETMVIGLLLGFGILIFGGRYFFRRIEDVDLSYGVAVKYLFVSAFIATLISTVAVAAIYGNNEALKKAYHDYEISAGETGLRMGLKMAGADKSTIESTLEEYREDIASGKKEVGGSYPYSFSNIHMTLGSGMVMGLFYALIAAIFVRVKHPE